MRSFNNYTYAALQEVFNERQRQDEKFGADRDIPSFVVIPGGGSVMTLAALYGIPSERHAKMTLDDADKRGELSWMHILVEEVAECVGAAGNDEALEKELVQVAAVAVAWIENLRRRRVSNAG